MRKQAEPPEAQEAEHQHAPPPITAVTLGCCMLRTPPPQSADRVRRSVAAIVMVFL